MDQGSGQPVVSTHPRTPIAGRYIVGEAFASGGMGTVHLGRVVGAGGFSRVVAIKRLFAGVAGDAAFRELLLEEARLVSRIRHPNVVPALDVVEADRELYIVMEYVNGPSLAHLLTEARKLDEPLPVAIALGIMEAVLHGLHAAHEARGEDGAPLGIVHRDVSPHNILVGADGVARLIDFGIAKAATRLQMTDPGVIKGKIGYMAPEQLLGESVSRHADVYASAVVLWEALSNRRFFEARATEADGSALEAGSVRRALETKVALPMQIRGAPNDAIDRVVMRGLELEPVDRFGTAEAMAVALRSAHAIASPVDIARWLGGFVPDELELAAERVRLLEQTPHAVTEEGRVVPEATHPGPARRRSHALWIGAGLVVAGSGALALRASTSRPLPPTPVPSISSILVPSEPEATRDPGEHASVAVASASAKPPLPAPVRRPARATKSECDPPYTIDGAGHKRYIPKCF